MIGGIDLGGTKIEARLFAPDLKEVARQRVPTPRGSYKALMDAVLSQISWLEKKGDIASVGIGTPGLVNPATGVFLTANLPATGRALAADLACRCNTPVWVLKDSRAAALSEAADGAAAGYRAVLGLTLGTGVSAAIVLDQTLPADLNGQAGEVGHTSLPWTVMQQHGLTPALCGCGLNGCYETFMSGPGICALALQLTGRAATPEQVMHDPEMSQIRDIWDDIASDLIANLTRTLDPQVVVLSGGLGMAEGLPERLAAALRTKVLTGTQVPAIVQAKYGDASGARGAALYALRMQRSA